MELDAFRITSLVIADYPGLDFDVIHHKLKLIFEEHHDAITAIGKPLGMGKHICRTLCEQERAKQLHNSDQYVYQPSRVKKVLEVVFDGPLDPDLLPDDYESILRGSDHLDFAADVQEAYRRLPLNMRASLYKCYALKEVPSNASYERKRVIKATNQLVYELNGRKN